MNLIRPAGEGIQLEASWRRGVVVTAPIPVSEVLQRKVNFAEVRNLSRREYSRQDFGNSHVWQFELHKDFARLASASRRERITILKRLQTHRLAIPYDLIVRRHLRWSPTGTRLISEWQRSQSQ